jgi:hypothetical protein
VIPPFYPQLISVTPLSCFLFLTNHGRKRKPLAMDEDAECMTQVELCALTKNIIEENNVNQDCYAATVEGIERKISGVVISLRLWRFVYLLLHQNSSNEQDERARRDEELRRRLHHNRQGMGGNNDNNHDNRNQGNRDPFAKVKFTIPAFYGAYDAKAYLDREMTVEQKLNSHLVSDVHKVRQATSEFKDFAIVWWNELVKLGTDPQTWDGLKLAMRSRFIPPSYKRNLRKKLQCLNQGSMSVQEYYQELQKGMLCCCVVEKNEDKMVHFYGGLNRNIQDIVDYKEYDSIQYLFQLAMLAEKELQGHQQSAYKGATAFAPRLSTSNIGVPSSHAPVVPSNSAMRASPSSHH